MVLSPRRRALRRGATLVEAALVLPLLLLFLLGVFEYGRLLMVLNLADNAAREGARFAVVNTNDQTTAQVQAFVLQRMASQDAQFQNVNVQVYQADPTSGTNLGAWTNAAFGQSIAVQVTGTYTPTAARFLAMSPTIPVQATAIMASEAN